MEMRLILILLLFPIMIQAQNTLDGSQFLELNQKASLTQPENNFSKKNFSWFEELEFRTETHDFLLVEQEYTFRLTPSSRGKNKARSSIQNHFINKPTFEWLDYQCKIVENAHNNWMDLYFIKKELNYYIELNELLKNREVLLNKKKSSLEFTTKDLIDFRIEQTKILSKTEALSQQIKLALSENEITGYQLDFSQFISIENIVLEIMQDNRFPTLTDQELEYDHALKEKELLLENEENRQIIDFVQIRFNGPNSNPLKERMSVGIGFSLPNSGNKVLKIQELKLKQQEIKIEKEIKKRIIEKEVNSARKKILFSINSYNDLKKILQEEELYLNELLNKIILNQDQDPEIIIDTRSHLIENKISLINVEKDIFQLFLQYLQDSGKLCSAPIKFYFRD
jgi:hypothetical protein